MSTITLDQVEAEIWRFGAEPVEYRMDEVLSVVKKFAKAQRRAEKPVGPSPAQLSNAVAQALPEPSAQPEAREEAASDAALAQPDAAEDEQPKECTLCGIMKPAIDYTIDRSVASGRRARCRPCDAKVRKQQKLQKQAKAKEKAAA